VKNAAGCWLLASGYWQKWVATIDAFLPSSIFKKNNNLLSFARVLPAASRQKRLSFASHGFASRQEHMHCPVLPAAGSIAKVVQQPMENN